MLSALADRRIFVCYKLVPKNDGTGKSDKVPVDPLTGWPSDAQNPASWMYPAEAQGWAALLGAGHGIGIVIHETGGLFCIDIDSCLQADGQWSPIVHAMLARFPGAAVEVSVSGTGVHIFGSTTRAMPPHGTKNHLHKMECYTKARFIACTNATGDPLRDFSTELEHVITEYFPPAQDAPAAGWTDEPHPDWNGPENDDELIALMLTWQSARAKFGKAVSFKDLWTNNVDKLREAWPSTTGKDYDGSSADQALANHLAFGTGGNCERMLGLMRISGLARAKYERPDYLHSTILKAAGWQTEYYSRTASNAVPAPAAPQPSPPVLHGSVGGHAIPPPPSAAQVEAAASSTTGRGGYLTPTEQLGLFDGCTYVEDVHQILLPPPLSFALDKSQFDVRFGGRTFALTADLAQTTPSAWEVFTSSQVCEFRQVRGMYFEPREAPNSIIWRDGVSFVNSWVPVEIKRIKGDPTPFFNHIRKLFPVGIDADIIIYYLAAMLQNFGVKSSWCIFLQGVEGNGKSLISKVMERIISERYTHRAKASELASRFNSPFYGKLFIPVEDVKISEDAGSLWETLKPMIDQTRLEIEAKGVNKVTREVCFNFILNSNHKDGIKKTQNDRRIAPFFAAQQVESDVQNDGLTTDYFVGLWNWIEGDGTAIVADALLSLQIPDEFNFATKCRRAPITSSTEAAKAESLGGIEQDVLAAIEDGAPGFCGGWICSSELDKLLANGGRSKFLTRNKRRDMLQNLGYTRHPHLPDGRLTGGLSNDPGARPRLYVSARHTSAVIVNQKLIRDLYEAAQKK